MSTQTGTHTPGITETEALQLTVSGRVQGVGFRPFVYRLAETHRLHGWVRNCTGQVEIRIQGNRQSLNAFTRRLFQHAPPLSQPVLEHCEPVAVAELDRFRIRESRSDSAADIHVPPDLYTCAACLEEMNDPQDRRYRYPFINCTQCGPRYTLIRGMPYDRPATTMAGFELCDDCRAEYTNPLDRRFHAEPVACPACGPSLAFRGKDGNNAHGNEAALAACSKALHRGAIIAVKGIGGYHLVCSAADDVAVERLRRTKPRPDKPLAVMFPSPADNPLQCVNRHVWLSRDQADLLLSPERPIVLARKRGDTGLSLQIAPGLDEIGAMLPYSPLHHLLLSDFRMPLVATSANISGEPVLTDADSVEQRLGHVADAFLHHDRPIQRPADDPVFRVISDRPRPLRTGRGTAPLELELPVEIKTPVLAVGAHMKNTIALAWQNRVVLSPHIGDMGNARSLAVFEQTVEDLQSLYGIDAEAIVCDAHPGYATTRWAEKQPGMSLHRVYHHHAHAAAALGNRVHEGQSLVFTWDGVGYGEDGTLWGGDALLGGTGNWRRFASLRPFRLPGGDSAGREPWRSAAALCWETGRDWEALPDAATLLQQAWEHRLNSPRTTAAGRLFDAAAALLGLCEQASYEGQGPMRLEAACRGRGNGISLPLKRDDDGLWISDWEALLPVLLDHDRTVAERSAVFHASLADTLLEQALLARQLHDVECIGLAGGVFQNRVLTESAIARLQQAGFDVIYPEHIPVNDAGISYGQVLEYALSASSNNDRHPETR